MPEFVLGMDAALYFTAAVFTAADEAAVTGASRTELTNVKDLTANMSKGEADVTTRANDGWRATAGTLKELELSFQMQWKPGDAGFEAIKDAWLNNDEVGLIALDQDFAVGGAQGPAGNFSVIGFEKGEPLEEAQTVDVTVKVSSFAQWFVKDSA